MPSFPSAGESIPAGTSGSNISFSQLRDSWFNADSNFSGLSDPGDETNVSLSDFNNAKLSDGTAISNSSGISIKNDFCTKTFLIPVTGVLLSPLSDTTPNESTTLSNYATAVISPSNANGDIKIEFTTASGGGASATPSNTGFQTTTTSSNTMDYIFSSVTSNTNVGNITVNVKQNGGSVIATHTLVSNIIIQETGGGGGKGGGSGCG